MIEPKDFLDQANRLINRDTHEVDFRTAISRAYYSLYHEAFVHLKRHPRGVLQRAIIDQINERGETPDMQKISTCDEEYLGRLSLHRAVKDAIFRLDRYKALLYNSFKDHRVDADYKLKLTVTHDDAGDIVNQIASFINVVKQL